MATSEHLTKSAVLHREAYPACRKEALKLWVVLARCFNALTQISAQQLKAFDMTPGELENLRANLKTGGLLFADACCGKPEFDRAFRAFAAKLLPEAKLEPIPVTDALYGAEINGEPIVSVRVRKERADRAMNIPSPRSDPIHSATTAAITP